MGPLTLAAASTWSGRSIGPVPAGEVHLWVMPLDIPMDVARQYLDSGELARAAGYRRPVHGARFAASRAGLRRLVAGYFDADPASLCFVPRRNGKPAAAVHDRAGGHATGGCELLPGFEFSLSRTDDLALVAVSTAAVGADIERIGPRPGLADLVAARFAPGETDCIAAGCGLPAWPAGQPQPEDRALRGFYRHWTAKEAFLKATGCGLAGLRRLEVSCRPRPFVRVGDAVDDGWLLSFPVVSPAHAAAVVGRHPVTRCEWLRG